MKKIFLFIIIFMRLQVLAQIQITKPLENEEIKLVDYDSLENFISDESKYGGYLTQKLLYYKIGQKYISSKDVFYIEDYGKVRKSAENFKGDWKKISPPIKMTNFIVLEVFKPKEKQPDEYDLANFCFKLKEEETLKTLFYCNYPSMFNQFPFVVSGYIEKMKEKIGKKYRLKIIKGEEKYSTEELLNRADNIVFITDYRNGKRVYFSDRDTLKIIDVKLNFEMGAVFIISSNNYHFVKNSKDFKTFNEDFLISIEDLKKREEQKILNEEQDKKREKELKEQEEIEYNQRQKLRNEKMLAYQKKYLNKVYYVCWQERTSIDYSKFYTTCEGTSFIESEIINLVNKTNLNLVNGAKYVVKDIQVNNYGEFSSIVLFDEGKQEIILDYSGLSEFERVAELEENRNKRLLESKEKLTRLQTKFGVKIGKLIFDRKVQVGMTKEMCRMAWGEPDKINTTTTRSGSYEQWVYSNSSYLYFEGGKLTTIQN